MRIALVCNDSRGGVAPYVALGLGLRASGHQVQAVAPSDLVPMFREVGLDATALSGSVQEVLSASGGAAERGSLASMRLAARELPGRILTWMRETLAACEGVDLSCSTNPSGAPGSRRWASGPSPFPASG